MAPASGYTTAAATYSSYTDRMGGGGARSTMRSEYGSSVGSAYDKSGTVKFRKPSRDSSLGASFRYRNGV